MIIIAATQSDANLCNALEPPTRGCNAGNGIHIVIPDDWKERILAGQDVLGCSYAQITNTVDSLQNPITILTVSDVVQAQLAVPASIQKLTPNQQLEASLFTGKLAVATSDPIAVASIDGGKSLGKDAGN